MPTILVLNGPNLNMLGVREPADGIILNAGAYTHTSIAIPDAISAAELPVIELHISNVYRREPFRHHSHISRVAKGVICGFGGHGYLLAPGAGGRVVRG